MGIKVFIKRLLSRVFLSSDRKVKEALDEAEIISFDIFDTLLKRDVHLPVQVHDLVKQRCKSELGIDLGNYSLQRIEAEKKARRQIKGEEITLQNIFEYLNMDPKITLGQIKDMEIEIETNVCCFNPEMKILFDKAIKAGKRVILTSDMYLPEKVVVNILKKCGYDGYEKLYLSSSFGKSKASGHLYDIILKDYPGMKRRIVHIGDNVRGDFLAPRLKGIRALLIKEHESKLFYWKKPACGKSSLSENLLYSWMNNHKDRMIKKNDAASMGYEVLGPVLLGFCQWLHRKIHEEEIEKIFFLSREGKLLQEAYQILYPEEYIPQYYLYASRQALLIPLLSDAKDYDDMIGILKCFLQVPELKTIGIVCQLNMKQFADGLEIAGLDQDIPTYEVPKNKKQEVFLLVQKLAGDRFVVQKELVKEYLFQNGFKGKIALVDIGWAGTMQHSLMKYVDKVETEIWGYYLGVRNVEEKSYYIGMKREGYLFSPSVSNRICYMIRSTKDFFELMFLNASGSVERYTKNELGQVIPHLLDSEFNEENIRFIAGIQETAKNFLREWTTDPQHKFWPFFSSDVVLKGYISLAVYPSMEVVDKFKGFLFLNGTFRTELPEKDLFYYILNPKVLWQEFNASGNKVFYLKKMFKINFPYFDLLYFLNSKIGIKSEYQKKYLTNQKNGRL